MQKTVQVHQMEYAERQKELELIRANYQRHMEHYARWLDDFKRRERERHDTRETCQTTTEA